MAINRKNIDMVNGSLNKGIISFVLPVILMGILQHLYNAADVMVVGRFAGSDALAGVGTTGPISNMILNVFLGMSAGVSVVLGRALGAKDDESVHKIVHTAILLSLIGGVIISAFGIIFAESLLKMIDVPQNVLPHAKIYMQIIFAGKIPALLYNFSSAILRAKGDTKRPLRIVTVSGAMNVVLNLLFVLVFKIGAAGVALATVISQTYTALRVLYILVTEYDNTKLSFSKLKIYKEQIKEIARIGIPSGIQSAMGSLSTVILQYGVNTFGSASIMAGNSAAANIQSFYFIIKNAFHQATVVFVSQNLGAKKYERINKVVLCSCGYMAMFWFVEILISTFGGRFLISLYAPNDMEAIKAGAIRLAIVGASYGIFGFSEILSGALRGMGRSIYTMALSLISNLGVKLLWIATVFRVVKTLPFLYMSFPLGWLMALIAYYSLYVYMINPKRIEKVIR